MRVAVLSDIHGNGVALQAVVDELRRHPVDEVVCLGDALQGGSQPRRVIELLGELGCPVVRGNADDYLVTGGSGEEVSERHQEVRAWTLEEIGPEGTAFLRSLVDTVELELPGPRRLLCFHGSPLSFDHVLLPETPDEEAAEMLAGAEADILTGGHTHLQWTGNFNGRLFFNPGSVGLAYNRLSPPESFRYTPVAEYAVLTVAEDIRLEFRHLRLEVAELASAALSSGRPYADGEATMYRA